MGDEGEGCERQPGREVGNQGGPQSRQRDGARRRPRGGRPGPVAHERMGFDGREGRGGGEEGMMEGGAFQ